MLMDTFFIPKLLELGHAGVQRWTRKVDIFSYDIIVIPVHVGGVHWCMAIIYVNDHHIKYFDSMGPRPNFPVLNALRQYLKDENVRICPQQRNGSDCGVFSCMVAEFLSRRSELSFEQDHMQYFRRKMVYEISTGRLVLGF